MAERAGERRKLQPGDVLSSAQAEAITTVCRSLRDLTFAFREVLGHPAIAGHEDQALAEAGLQGATACLAGLSAAALLLGGPGDLQQKLQPRGSG